MESRFSFLTRWSARRFDVAVFVLALAAPCRPWGVPGQGAWRLVRAGPLLRPRVGLGRPDADAGLRRDAPAAVHFAHRLHPVASGNLEPASDPIPARHPRRGHGPPGASGRDLSRGRQDRASGHAVAGTRPGCDLLHPAAADGNAVHRDDDGVFPGALFAVGQAVVVAPRGARPVGRPVHFLPLGVRRLPRISVLRHLACEGFSARLALLPPARARLVPPVGVWMARNYHKYGRLVPLSGQMGSTLYEASRSTASSCARTRSRWRPRPNGWASATAISARITSPSGSFVRENPFRPR